MNALTELIEALRGLAAVREDLAAMQEAGEDLMALMTPHLRALKRNTAALNAQLGELTASLEAIKRAAAANEGGRTSKAKAKAKGSAAAAEAPAPSSVVDAESRAVARLQRQRRRFAVRS